MEENEIENKIVQNKNETISEVNKYLDTCLSSDKKHIKKANYNELTNDGIKDYIKYIEQEETFNSSLLKEYSRGDVIKVNLGFNVGNEEGGLHYCIVLDKKNAKSYSTLTIIPLTSLKETSKKNNTSVFLGDELRNAIFNKVQTILNSIDTEKAINYQRKIEKNLDANRVIEKITDEERNALKDFKEKYPLIEKTLEEAKQMKKGSIALINQITTISKQRIYNPKKELDILSGIKISDEKMKLIDEKIKKLFIN